MSSIDQDEVNQDVSKFKNDQKETKVVKVVGKPFENLINSLWTRWCWKIHTNIEDPTIEDIYRKFYPIDNQDHIFDIYDTTESEDMASMRGSYLLTYQCFLFCFDLNRLESLYYLEKNIETVLRLRNDDSLPMILVGTKCDLNEVADDQIIDSFCQKHSLLFIKTSSKNHINVEDTFVMAANEIQKNFKDVYPNTKNSQKPKSNCEIM